MRLLGYTDTNGDTSGSGYGEAYKQSLAVLNLVVGELSVAETGRLCDALKTVHAELPLSDRAARLVAPYGVAMYLAAAQGDGDHQQLFAALYDQKRASVRGTPERRVDRLPRGWDT